MVDFLTGGVEEGEERAELEEVLLEEAVLTPIWGIKSMASCNNCFLFIRELICQMKMVCMQYTTAMKRSFLKTLYTFWYLTCAIAVRGEAHIASVSVLLL